MATKRWWKSKTVWIGILTCLGSLTAIVVEAIQTGRVNIEAVAGTFVGLATIITRFNTDSAIE